MGRGSCSCRLGRARLLAGGRGIGHATSDLAESLARDDVDAVILSTPMQLHAAQAIQCMQAGKHVLCEKPLALTRAELSEVEQALAGSPGLLMVGFNRRFAPLSIEVRDRLAKAPGTKFVLLRVNAGGLPPESWIRHADEGGGRILGEVCHFVDLARFLIGAPIASVQAEAASGPAGACDDVTATLRFKDGSLATVAYTALGDSAAGKELIEAYAGGTVLTLDDFRTLGVTREGRSSTERARHRDKGFRGSLEAFVKAVAAGGPAPIDEAELVETSIATVAVMESLRSGARIDL